MPQAYQTIYTGMSVTRPRVVVPPTIPGLQVWAFFGTDTTGLAGNRVAGGPVLASNGVGPSYQSDKSALFNPGGVVGGLDTTIPRAALLNGFSMMWASVSSGGLPAAVASDSGGNAFSCSMQTANTDQANQPTMSLGVFGSGIGPGSEIVTGDQTTMKLFALTWGGNAGGGGSPLTGYSLTDNLSGATANASAVSSGVSTLKIGASSTGVTCHQIKLSWWMLALGAPLSQPDLQTIAASVRTLLNRRAWLTI